MKALVWTAPGQMELQEQNVPQVRTDEVLVKVAYAGICGSELSGYLGHNALRVPPLVMGHEFSGEIASLGSQALMVNPRLAEGQKVTVNPFSCAGDSIFQEQGLDQLCLTTHLARFARRRPSILRRPCPTSPGLRYA